MSGKVRFVAAVVALFCTEAYAAPGCKPPQEPQYPDMSAYPKSLIDGATANQQRGYADASFWKVNEFCRQVYNWYENRAKCAESYKVGVGVMGGVFGIAGTVMATAGTGGAFPGIAAGVAGLASTTLGNAEKGPLGTAAYEARRAAVGQAIENGVKSFAAAKDANEANVAAISLLSQCPVPKV